MTLRLGYSYDGAMILFFSTHIMTNMLNTDSLTA